MAYPFGGHPTLAQYVKKVTAEFGCTEKTSIVSDEDGRPLSVTKIENPAANKFVHVIGVMPREHLTPTQVGNLDRRLGIVSGYVSLDGGDDA